MPHPDEGLLHAWLDGELDAAEAARVEAQVASDPAWAAAAAEARGLVAASARIVGALDRVPANVRPATGTKGRGDRRWLWRAAAALVLMAGSAVAVLERGTPVLTAPAPVEQPAVPAVPPATVETRPAPGAAPAVAKKAAPAALLKRPGAPAAAVQGPEAAGGLAAGAPGLESKSTFLQKVPDEPNQRDATRDNDVAKEARPVSGGTQAASAGAARRVAPEGPPRAAGAPPALAQAVEKTTRLQPSCFLLREPRDSATRVIRLDAAALADSIRLERLTLRGDTLAAVSGRLTAVRVPCPAP